MPILTYKAKDRGGPLSHAFAALCVFAQMLWALPSSLGQAPSAACSNGTELRLIPLSDEFMIGRPAEFAVELLNNSGHTVRYDDQCLGNVQNWISLQDSDGASPAIIAHSGQTVGSDVELPAGQRAVLLDRFDLTACFLIARPGQYRMVLQGRSVSIADPEPEPASASVTIEFKPGNLRGYEEALKALLPACPPDWQPGFIRAPNPIGKGATPDSERFSLALLGPRIPPGSMSRLIIRIEHSKAPLTPEELQNAALGAASSDKWGYVYLGLSDEAERIWPECRSVIARALGMKDR